MTIGLIVFACAWIGGAFYVFATMYRHWHTRRATLVPIMEAGMMLAIGVLALIASLEADYRREAVLAIATLLLLNGLVLWVVKQRSTAK